MTRDDLRSSADAWRSVGAVFLILAIAGSAIAGFVLAPTETDSFTGDEDTNTGAGVAIAAAMMVGSLVAVLPYFILSRLMAGVAELLPDAEPDEAPQGPPDEPAF